MNQIYWCALKPVTVIELKCIVSQSVVVYKLIHIICLMHKTVVHKPLNLLIWKLIIEVEKIMGKPI